MFFVIAAATVLLHPSVVPPAAQLAAAQRAVSFRLLEMPQSVELLHAEVKYEAGVAAGVVLEYSAEGKLVSILERPAVGTDSEIQPDAQTQEFNLDGYEADLRTLQRGFQPYAELVWHRPDVSVTLWSYDRVSPPLLVDLALELR